MRIVMFLLAAGWAVNGMAIDQEDRITGGLHIVKWHNAVPGDYERHTNVTHVPVPGEGVYHIAARYAVRTATAAVPERVFNLAWEWDGITNITFRIEQSRDLANWTPLAFMQANVRFYPVEVAGTRLFYRVLVESVAENGAIKLAPLAKPARIVDP